MIRNRSLSVVMLAMLFVVAISGRVAVADPPSFSRDILPILSDNCFHCHGPDAKTREADLRLDSAESALRKEKPVIVPGKSADSELMRRLVTTDPDLVMPPPKSGRTLTATQKELLRSWIDSGAAWGKHWAFEKPQRSLVPAVGNESLRNPIDAFVRDRLKREGLSPSPSASRETLIRRVTLDLTGLPPTLEELDRFLADKSDHAYEALVDRLLKSPRFGERMVWEWLDAARYADTNGYQGDPTRTMYFWRDWVIDALNQNMPFDQFSIEQLAGDQLPSPTQSQLIATGFHRNHMINGEGGRIAEESRVDYVQDRVETTGTVWMGLTLNCCRCHDHKYDPLTQKEYYQLSAFFNSIDESGANDAGGLANPVISLATPDGQQKIAEAKVKEQAANKERTATEQRARESFAVWEQTQRDASRQAPAWITLTPEKATSQNGATLTILEDGSVVASGTNPATDVLTITTTTNLAEITGLRLEALPDDRFVNKGPGRADNGNFVLTELHASVATKPLTLTAVRATTEQTGFPIGNAVDRKNDTGWAIAGAFGQTQTALFAVTPPLKLSAPEQNNVPVSIRLEFLSPHISHVLGKFRLSLTNSPLNATPLPDNIRSLLAIEPAKRSDAQQKELAEFHLNSDLAVAAARKNADDARKARENVERSQPRTMVMRERAQPRDTFLLIRGAYDKYGDKVTHGVPAILPQPAEIPNSRLALARWLTSDEHPLTARVTVNRFWQSFFGIGLVKTTEDFGIQGEKPSHPELLDWLATEFVRSEHPVEHCDEADLAKQLENPRWNMKRLIRLIVTSQTYRQSSRVNRSAAANSNAATSAANQTPSLIDRDPDNRLLARGPRYRLPSWMIRDQALAVSGLLVEKLGGPPVKGYQPPGIWEEATFGRIGYQQETGEALYRRSLYQFWRRIVGPTVFFDVAARQTCQVKVARTNTPLHALVTLNDVTYVEAARHLAQRVLSGPATQDSERLREAFRRCTSRTPSDTELSVLAKRLQTLRESFARDEAAAKKLITVGDSKASGNVNAVELAAFTSISSLLLNLDETITKE